MHKQQSNEKGISGLQILVIFCFLFLLFLIFSPSKTPEEYPGSQQEQQQVIKYTAVSLNFRSVDNINKVLRVLDKGTPVIIVEEGGKWTLVEVDEQQGYVATRYLASEKIVEEEKEVVYSPPPTNSRVEELEQKVEELEKKQQEAQEKMKKEKEELERQTQALKEQLQQQPQGIYKTSELVEGLSELIVAIGCFDYSGDIMTGSGVVIGKGKALSSDRVSTAILTNYHIIKNADMTLEHPCAVGYSPNPTKGLTDFYFANPVYYPSIISDSEMELIDFYFLSIEEKLRIPEYGDIEIIPNASLEITEYVPIICEEDKIKVGEEMIVLGYPSIGGDYLTATEGIISGYEGKHYLTTSAKIEHGNSGGGAFLKSSGCLTGMPTFVRLGEMESFARLINMPVLARDYLSKIWDY